jgi:hypothetical protein
MKKFEYEIKLTEDGKPYIHLENNKMDAEDRFACVEITRYMIFQLIESDNEFPEDFIKDLAIAGDMINGISGKLSNLIKGQMDALEGANDLLNDNTEDEE